RQEWEPPEGALPNWSAVFDASLKHHACSDQAGNVRIFETDTRREVARLPAPKGKVRDITHRLSSDGRHLAAVYHFEDGSFQFILWGLSPAGPPHKVGPLDGVACFALREDGRQLAVLHPDATLALHDLDQPGRRTLPNLHCRIMAYRPDGRQLAFNTHRDQEL